MEDLDVQLRRLLDADRLTEALQLLHQSYGADLARFVRFSRPSAQVEDLCQEVWLAARRALPRFRFEAMPRTWLLAIARRKLADHLRRPSRRRLLPLPSRIESFKRILIAAPIGPRPPSTPSSQLRRKRRAGALQEELGRLDPVDRELLELRFVSGLKPAAIIGALGLDDSPNAVSQRIVRLVRKLRERLLLHDDFEPT